MLKILHVVTGLQKSAGTSVFCGELANKFAGRGDNVTVAVCDPCASDIYPLDPRVHLASIGSILQPPSASRDSTFSIVHIHALWTPILHKVSSWAHGHSIPVVWSPHGMITPWAMNNKRLKKWLGWWLYQKRDLESAAVLHATAQSEVEDIRRMGLPNKVVVVPLGVELHGVEPKKPRIIKTLLFVSRIQRKKGLPMLLEAWARLPQEIKRGWQIRIVGPDQEGHVAELKQQCDVLRLTYNDEPAQCTSPCSLDDRPSVVFAGPKFGNELEHEYASADLFVLPTRSENFGSVVIEALAHNIPVICTRGAPWQELEEYNCGRWVDISAEAVGKALSDLMMLSDEARVSMGEKGRNLVVEKYTWKAVCDKIVTEYERILTAKDYA